MNTYEKLKTLEFLVIKLESNQNPEKVKKVFASSGMPYVEPKALDLIEMLKKELFELQQKLINCYERENY